MACMIVIMQVKDTHYRNMINSVANSYMSTTQEITKHHCKNHCVKNSIVYDICQWYDYYVYLLWFPPYL